MSSSLGNFPAPFLTKVWKMVSDPKTNHLISWRQCGNVFTIFHEGHSQFCFNLLPLYFKHSNFSTFVRQLNFYGFHKVSCLDDAGSAEKDLKSISFHHHYFRRDAPELLKKIKRKSSQPRAKPNESQNVIDSNELNEVLKEIGQLRGRQCTVDSQLSAIEKENSILWRELALLRQKHGKQQLIVDKLVEFLSTLVGPSTSQKLLKERMPLMLDESRAKTKRICVRDSPSTDDQEPTIHELDLVAELSPEQSIEEASMEDDMQLIDSPNSDFAQNSPESENLSAAAKVETFGTRFWDEIDVDVETDGHALHLAENEEEIISNSQKNAGTEEELSLNTGGDGDSLVSRAMSSTNSLGRKNRTKAKINLSTSKVSAPSRRPDIRVAIKKDTPTISNGGDRNLHLDNSQCESDLFKLSSCSESGLGVRAYSLQKNNSTIEKGIKQAPTNNCTELLDEDSDSPDVVFHEDIDSEDENRTEISY